MSKIDNTLKEIFGFDTLYQKEFGIGKVLLQMRIMQE